MRLFVALDIGDAIRQQVAELQSRLQVSLPSVRWVRTEGLHITLKFLGEQPDQLYPEIVATLRTVQLPRFHLAVRGYGFFPEVGSARVFWLGVHPADSMDIDTERSGSQLEHLAAAVDEVLASRGLPREQHPYHPHLTLARNGSGRPQQQGPGGGGGTGTADPFARLRDALQHIPALDFGTIAAHEFFLYHSRLAAGGSIYTPRARFPLL